MSFIHQYIYRGTFEAALSFDGIGIPEKFKRFHGHSYKFTISESNTIKQENAIFPRLVQINDSIKNRLDYQNINKTTGLSLPNDAFLIQWIINEFNNNEINYLSLKSTSDSGVYWEKNSGFNGFWETLIHSAHFLPNLPENHKCHNLHGHNFKIVLGWKSECADNLMPYWSVKEIFNPFFLRLHQKILNDIPGLENPTSEGLCFWLWEKIKIVFPELSSVTVYETATSGCTYRGNNWESFKELNMDCAIDGPKGIMGHSYIIKLFVTGKLDPTFNWTLDFGEIKNRFAPFYKMIDHKYLSQVEGLISPDKQKNLLLELALWIFKRLQGAIPILSAVQIEDTPESGIFLKITPDINQTD